MTYKELKKEKELLIETLFKDIAPLNDEIKILKEKKSKIKDEYVKKMKWIENELYKLRTPVVAKNVRKIKSEINLM